MQEKIVFDSSTIISLSEKCFLKILQKMAQQSKAKFVIPESVFEEIVRHPLNIKRFELSAIRIQGAVESGWMKVQERNIETAKLMEKIDFLANNAYSFNGHSLKLVQKGEIEALAILKQLNANTLAIDERTTRMMIEEPARLRNYISFKSESSMEMNRQNIAELQQMFKGINIVRSAELIALAYERNFFEGDLPQKRQSLEAALYAVKYSGCAISGNEIDAFVGLK